MKYLLIPIEEINSRIEELKIHSNDSFIHQQRLIELESLKSKGEIVENIPHTYGENYKLIKTVK